ACSASCSPKVPWVIPSSNGRASGAAEYSIACTARTQRRQCSEGAVDSCFNPSKSRSIRRRASGEGSFCRFTEGMVRDRAKPPELPRGLVAHRELLCVQRRNQPNDLRGLRLHRRGPELLLEEGQCL